MTTILKWRISTQFGEKTEKDYWVNGYNTRGKDFKTFAVSFKNNAFLFSFSYSLKYISFNTYKLI